jgi:hypothetical protein
MSFPLATGTRTERTKGMPRAGPEGESGAIASQHHRRVPLRSRAWQGRTRPVTFRERRKLYMPCRPAAIRRVRPFKSSGPAFPECSRRHPYCFRQHTQRIWGRGEKVRRRGPAQKVLFSAFALIKIWKMQLFARVVRNCEQRYTWENPALRGISAWDGEIKESSRT